jgi:hypothetical protein
MRRLFWPVVVLLGLVIGINVAVESNKPWWLRDLTGPSMPAWLRDVLGLRWGGQQPVTPQPLPFPLPTPRPKPAPRTPQPKCPGPNCPQPKWGPEPVALIGSPVAVNGQRTAAKFVVGGPSMDGVEVACDLPAARHQRNTGGSDGAGLCVFTSVGHCADWHGENQLTKFRDWMKSRPGGGYPDKLKKMIAEFSRETGITEPPYLQVTNGDVAILEEAHEHRIMLAVTYSGRDGIYYRSSVPHMVNLVCYDKAADRAAILDNNYPGQLLWMSCKDFVERWKEGGGGGWAVALLKPPPPPVPVNRTAAREPVMIGQCASCGPAYVPPPAMVAPALAAPSISTAASASGSSGWEWRQSVTDPAGYWCLFKDGKQVGCYRRRDDLYSSLGTDGQFQHDVLPPVPIPESAWATAGTPRGGDHQPIFGVEPDKVRRSPGYEINGVPVSREQLLGAIHAAGSGVLPDVKGKVWVVVAGGTPEQRSAVLRDLETNPELAPFKPRIVVQSYAAGEWPLAVGIQSSGAPTIQLLGPETDQGKAVDLGRLDSYPGPAVLADTLHEALREVDPNYRPELARRKGSDPLANIDPTILVAVGGFLLFLVLTPRRRR